MNRLKSAITILRSRQSFLHTTMAPKRTASGSKRKASTESEISDLDAPSVPSAKKARTTKKKEPVLNGQPTNTVIPVSVSFPAKSDGSLRLSAWNVSGLNASLKKSFNSYVEAENADILVLTETKVNEQPNSFLQSQYPHQYWSISSTKGYAGTAVLTKIEPLGVKWDLPGHDQAEEAAKGRLVVLEYPSTWVVATYVPNAGQQLKKLDYKAAWNEAFAKYIHELNTKKPVIWMGDINCAPTPQDLANHKTNWNKTPGHTQIETDGFNKILNVSSSQTVPDLVAKDNLIDVWRHLHPELQHYTYFSYKFKCREKTLGWRLDMFLISRRIISRIKFCEIRSEIYGASDHCPIVLEIEGDL
ncbi:Endonuclease/exonuclease/phosphatase [Gautieria morchelliformis]|nr:Endonuclease/exonuclease/phosphatase [Gautieria morchelliformis]